MDEIIKVKNLVKRFDENVAVDNISFSVIRGEVFAFLGPNGAGKSTTIKMMTTLLHPTSGEMSINGFDASREQDAARKSFGIVFQDPSVDEELTAWENMYFHSVMYGVPKKLAKQRIDELLEMVQLSDRRDSLVKSFSGGMKRRLEIARGLLHHPQIIFLDEPTLGLDPQTRNQIWSHISELNKKEGITIFFTTHYLEEAEKMADRIAIIDHGRIVAIGSADELEKQVGASSLEEAFLAITGKAIREESVDGSNFSRMRRGMRQK